MTRGWEGLRTPRVSSLRATSALATLLPPRPHRDSRARGLEGDDGHAAHLSAKILATRPVRSIIASSVSHGVGTQMDSYVACTLSPKVSMRAKMLGARYGSSLPRRAGVCHSVKPLSTRTLGRSRTLDAMTAVLKALRKGLLKTGRVGVSRVEEWMDGRGPHARTTHRA